MKLQKKMLQSQNKTALMENPKNSNKLEKLSGAIYLVGRKPYEQGPKMQQQASLSSGPTYRVHPSFYNFISVGDVAGQIKLLQAKINPEGPELLSHFNLAKLDSTGSNK